MVLHEVPPTVHELAAPLVASAQREPIHFFNHVNHI